MGLKQLEPKEVFGHFCEISKIPRGSGNEKAVSDYIAKFARGCDVEVFQDEWNNLTILKKASVGREGSEPIILQAHLDMVCEKNAGTAHDFLRDPLDLYVDGDYLKARGTTLGADNGIGVAMCMALLAGAFEHPPLEIILTTDEEAGMGGAENLDISRLAGKRMLNLDSNDDKTFTMGCAAGTTAEIIIPAERTSLSGGLTCCEISVRGLLGGHSGGDIHRGRGNAIKILALVLEEMCYGDREIYLGEISGGMKVNAIPREACAKVVFPESKKEKIINALEECKRKQENIFSKSDPDIKIAWEFFYHTQDFVAFFTEQCTEKIIAAIIKMPNGVTEMSREIEGLVNASCNIGVAETTAEYVKILAMPRGATTDLVCKVEEKISAATEQANGTANFLQRSPAWPYNPNSELLKRALQTYKTHTGCEAAATAVHAGLECGIFSAKFASKNVDLDIVSYGPNAHEYHTPNEKLSISSTGRVWGFLLELLSNI